MATKRIDRAAEVCRRLGRTDARATAKGACRAVSESPAAALPEESRDLAEKAGQIDGGDRG